MYEEEVKSINDTLSESQINNNIYYTSPEDWFKSNPLPDSEESLIKNILILVLIYSIFSTLI